MRSLGSIIRETRESKNLSIKDLEAQTHILSKYIEAIENEKFSELPGEVYVRGFLSNISKKLDLETNQILTLYKLQMSEPKSIRNEDENNNAKKNENTEIAEEKALSKKLNKKEKVKKEQEEKKLQDQMFEISKKEQDLLLPPIQKIRRKRRLHIFPKVITVFIILAVISAVVLIFIYRNTIFSSLPKMTKVENNDNNRKRNIVDNYTKIGVRSGDIIYFKPIGVSATISFESIGNTVKATINDIEVSFSKTNPLLADLNKNGVNDFRIQLIDVIEDVAMIEIEKIEENTIQTTNTTTPIEGAQYTNTNMANQYAALTTIGNDTYILSDTDKTNITLECTAKKFVYIRYFVDSENPNTTNLSTGKSITINANDTIMLTVGNAGEVIVKINNRTIYLGKNGETVNKTIKWVRNINNTTKYDLIMTDTK